MKATVRASLAAIAALFAIASLVFARLWYRSGITPLDVALVVRQLPPSCQRVANSRKDEPGCLVAETEVAAVTVYPLLVTGLGGSGTHEATTQLRSSGVDVAHEEIRPDGAVVRVEHVSCVLPIPRVLNAFLPIVMVLCGKRRVGGHRVPAPRAVTSIHAVVSQPTVRACVSPGALPAATHFVVHCSPERVV